MEPGKECVRCFGWGWRILTCHPSAVSMLFAYFQLVAVLVKLAPGGVYSDVRAILFGL